MAPGKLPKSAQSLHDANMQCSCLKKLMRVLIVRCDDSAKYAALPVAF